MFLRLLLSLPVFIGQIFRCIFIGCVIGPMAFFLGQLLPRQNFDYEAYPYRAFKWERDGLIYTKLRIQKWKDKLPDMSRAIRSMMKKRISVFRDEEYLDGLIRETCVAELVHVMLILLSPIYVLLLEGIAGPLGAIVYSILNVPFILIQRYNRPRLVILRQRQIQLNEAMRREQAASAQAGLATEY